MIALKREVAAGDQQVFRGANVKLGNWRQVTVRNYYNSHCDVIRFWRIHAFQACLFNHSSTSPF